MKKKLIKFLEKNLDFKLNYFKLLEIPKLESQGDFTFPCFILAKEIGKTSQTRRVSDGLGIVSKKNSLNPNEISKELEVNLSKKLPIFLSKVQAIGPFLNFYLNNEIESKDVISNILNNKFIKLNIGKKQTIMLEYPSPNTNKSLHLGHVRNMLIGNSLSLILERAGFKIIKTNMNNDRGIAICKAMLVYKMFGKNSTPKSMELKPDEFVSYYYVLFGQKNKEQSKLELEKKAQEMLLKWEEGDKEIRDLWKKLQDYVFEGYKETYKNFKLEKFDRQYFESQIYSEGKEIVLNAIKKKIRGFVREEDGAIAYDFGDKKYGKKYLLRGDGTTLYMTQDLYLASLKEKEFKFDKSIFIVGQEQKYHFEVLFHLLEILGLSKKGSNYHFAYGYVYDKDGKKFASREGKTIGADWLLQQTILKAKSNLKQKELTTNLSEKELEKRAKIIGFSALSFSFLKINPLSSINFDLDKSLLFEGETGPYCLYSYARIQSVLKKAKIKNIEKLKFDYSVFGEKEISLIKILKTYLEVLEEVTEKYKISAIANFLIKLCQSYNDFYQNCNILNEEKNIKEARLVLSYCVSIVIKDALFLLNIETLNEM